VYPKTFGPSRGRRQAVAGACVAAVLALAGCQASGTAKAAATPTATTPLVVTVTAASHVRTLGDCRRLAPAL